jgi:hypothetical protein
LQTPEQPHAPEAVAAGDGIGEAVLLEFLRVDIFAGNQVAVGAERVFMAEYFLAEGSERRIVPYFPDAPFAKVPEGPGDNMLFPS